MVITAAEIPYWLFAKRFCKLAKSSGTAQPRELPFHFLCGWWWGRVTGVSFFACPWLLEE
jgi:hypothetical protein